MTSEQLARFEEMGEEAVRLHVNNAGFNTTNQRLAIKWLTGKAQELERRRDSSQAEMAATASRAATTAERAAAAAELQARTAKDALITAVVATIIVAIALIVSILGSLHFLG
jgi:hypothetical protein